MDTHTTHLSHGCLDIFRWVPLCNSGFHFTAPNSVITFAFSSQGRDFLRLKPHWLYIIHPHTRLVNMFCEHLRSARPTVCIHANTYARTQSGVVYTPGFGPADFMVASCAHEQYRYSPISKGERNVTTEHDLISTVRKRNCGVSGSENTVHPNGFHNTALHHRFKELTVHQKGKWLATNPPPRLVLLPSASKGHPDRNATSRSLYKLHMYGQWD